MLFYSRGASYQLDFNEENYSTSRFNLGFKEEYHYMNYLEFSIPDTLLSCLSDIW